jgi:hypothetical protein
VWLSIEYLRAREIRVAEKPKGGEVLRRTGNPK